MNFRKFAAVTLAVLMILPILSSCDRLKRIRGDEPKILTYENADYHFTLTYPSQFSQIKEIPSEENGDEYKIQFEREDGRQITVDIVYKKAEQIGQFAAIYCPDKNSIIPLSDNSFAYDKRNCAPYEKPAYYIYASTKRMLYTVKYEYEHGEEDADEIVSALSFEFDIYANIYKNNAFLLPAAYLSYGRMSVMLPGNMTTKFYPNPESAPDVVSYDENNEPSINTDYLKYYALVTSSSHCVFAMSMPNSSKFTPSDLSNEAIDSEMLGMIAELSTDKIQNVKKVGKAEQRTSSKMQYRIINFSCTYNGGKASGSLTVGYTMLGKYFEYVYAVTDDASDQELDNFLDMIESISAF
ncbi:MAG: hypothetical protein J5585_02660 [Clostridia bacterium]|nr:hypothetical protein [Clostridia bacterium]